MTLLIFLLVLSLLVVVHELGHYLAAKLFGVNVPEFGLGYPPRAKKLFKRWGTWFTLNWIPVGGFVRLDGEERVDAGSARRKLSAKEARESTKFYDKRGLQRGVIILAGASMNFVYGVVAFSVMFSILGVPELVDLDKGVRVAEVVVDSPASRAGLVSGDLVMAVGEPAVAVNSTDEFVGEVAKHNGEELAIEFKHEGETKKAGVYVRKPEEIPSNEGAIGVVITDKDLKFVSYPWWQMPFRGAYVGLMSAVEFGIQILVLLFEMVRNLIMSGVVPDEVGGPIRIVYEAKKANILSEGITGLLNWSAILSINLAIVNVLPIPALDGGRALFILIEKALGKRFKPVYEQYANVAGMGLLLVLVVLISLRDVGVIFNDNGWGVGSLVSGIAKLLGG